jgi:uncharacterized zinc-type alcohol dehydrogenase-like protein
MLALCADHGIHPETKLIGAEEIDDAWERELSSGLRYRFIIGSRTL